MKERNNSLYNRTTPLIPKYLSYLIFILILTIRFHTFNFFNKMNDQSWCKIKNNKYLGMERILFVKPKEITSKAGKTLAA
jgi:hypothetical protein